MYTARLAVMAARPKSETCVWKIVDGAEPSGTSRLSYRLKVGLTGEREKKSRPPRVKNGFCLGAAINYRNHALGDEETFFLKTLHFNIIVYAVHTYSLFINVSLNNEKEIKQFLVG